MEDNIKKAMMGVMVTLGTDNERKFAWCLRRVEGRDMIYIHERRNGLSKFNADDYITSFPVDTIIECQKLLF